MKPQFYILGGPNGAGKSTVGHLHVIAGTHIFNGDLIYAALLERYPNYDPEKLKGGVPSQLEKDKAAALSQRKHFAFETNYSTDLAKELTQEFRINGYETTMIYFGIDDLESSLSRVKVRVSLGGHDVQLKDIAFNLTEGIVRVKKDIRLFDNVLFVDTSTVGKASVIASYRKDIGDHLILQEDVNWFNLNFKEQIIEMALRKKRALATLERLQAEEEIPTQKKQGRRGPKR